MFSRVSYGWHDNDDDELPTLLVVMLVRQAYKTKASVKFNFANAVLH